MASHESGAVLPVGAWVFLSVCLWCGPAGAAEAAKQKGPEWWERGQDTWCYKDDWKGPFLQGSRSYKKTFQAPGRVRAAFAYVWSSGEYTFKVNGKEVGRDVDSGTVEDYDIAKLLVEGENTVEIDTGGEMNCEVAAAFENGQEIHFGTDASWGPRTNPSETRRRGPRGYGGDCHMARVRAVSAEQRAKVLVNRLNSARVRILDLERYLFWRNRDPREVLTLDRPTEERGAWSRIETLLEESRPSIAAAAARIKQGKLAEVEAAAAPAVAKTDEAERLVRNLTARLKARNAERKRSLLGGRAEARGEHVTFNGSKYNRLGWVASAEPLDSDPAYWEADIAPPGARSIALAGLWRFSLDQVDRGAKLGWAGENFDDSQWKHIYAPTKWGWERWGHKRDAGRYHFNKPYNGFAWYRKKLVVPESWRDNDLVLRLGPRWGNQDWLAVNGQFISIVSGRMYARGEPTGKGSNSETITIPADLVRFGKENTLALRVFNNSNIGGIINPGLRLSVEGAEPRNLRSVCGPASVRELVYETPEGKVTQVVYSSALSPAVVVATSGRSIRLGGWAARGYIAPDCCAFIENGALQSERIRAGSPTGLARRLGENWLLIWGELKGPGASRPLLMVFERRPEAVAFPDDGFGGRAVELQFAQPGARVLILRPFDPLARLKPTATELERCRLWSRALLRYPVGYLERLRFEGDTCRVKMTYEYLDLKDDWNTEPVTMAPLPMLFSYAIEHKWPRARLEGTSSDLGCRVNSGYYPVFDCGTYRVVPGRSELSYSFDRMEPKAHYKGAGSLGEERRHGEPMFKRMADWGFNCYRPQVGLPNPNDWNDPKNPKVVSLRNSLKWCRKYDLFCMINWFRSQALPKDRVRGFTASWVALVEQCKNLPEDLVCYNFINEPAGIQWDDYNRLMKYVTEAVRDIDEVHLLSIESGGGWAQPEDLDMMEPTGDPKTIYQFHFYGPHTGRCHYQDLWYPRYQFDEERFRSYEGWEERMLSPVRFQIRHSAEVIHGEFGISFLGPDEAPRRWLEDVLAIHEKYRMHWNWWNYSGNNVNRTGLVAGERINPLVETLSEYARMRPPK